MTAIIGTCHLCCKTAQLRTEHIIPESIGGVLKKRLYCETCNCTCGHSIDAELARQFGPFATFLHIPRERGKNQPVSITCETTGLEMRCDGQTIKRAEPVVKVHTKNESGALTGFEVYGRSLQETKTISDGLINKHNLDPKDYTVESIWHPPSIMSHNFVINNELIRRGIAKIAYGFACIKLPIGKILSPSFDNTRDFILGNSKQILSSPNFTHTNFIIDNEKPLHRVHLSLNGRNRLFVGYVALFGTFRYTVLLSENIQSELQWPGFDYTYNPLTQREIPTRAYFVAPALTRQEVVSKQSAEQIDNALQKGWEIAAAHSPVMGQVLSVGVVTKKDQPA